MPSDDERVWILEGPALEAEDAATNASGIAFFANPARRVLYPSDAAVTPPPSWHVTTWEKFDSLAAFELATIPANVTVVGYDNEGGRLPSGDPWTPPDEWQDCSNGTCSGVVDPAVVEQSMETFASVAHGLGKKVIFMPGADLFGGTASTKYDAYVMSNVAATVAPVADYYHIQSQGLEPTPADSSTGAFVTFVSEMRQQTHAANPKTIVTAGVSTEANGTPVTSQNIADAVNATATIVRGYWPNDVDGEDAVLNGAFAILAPASPAP